MFEGKGQVLTYFINCIFVFGIKCLCSKEKIKNLKITHIYLQIRCQVDSLLTFWSEHLKPLKARRMTTIDLHTFMQECIYVCIYYIGMYDMYDMYVGIHVCIKPVVSILVDSVFAQQGTGQVIVNSYIYKRNPLQWND